MIKDYKILFVIYTPYIGYVPKRMKELEEIPKDDNVERIVVTPETLDVIMGKRAHTVHLIMLHPDNTVDPVVNLAFYTHVGEIRNRIEAIKIRNI